MEETSHSSSIVAFLLVPLADFFASAPLTSTGDFLARDFDGCGMYSEDEVGSFEAALLPFFFGSTAIPSCTSKEGNGGLESESSMGVSAVFPFIFATLPFLTDAGFASGAISITSFYQFYKILLLFDEYLPTGVLRSRLALPDIFLQFF